MEIIGRHALQGVHDQVSVCFFRLGSALALKEEDVMVEIEEDNSLMKFLLQLIMLGIYRDLEELLIED